MLETRALPSAPQPWLALSAWAGRSHRLQGAPGDAPWSHFCTKSGAYAGRPARFGGSLARLWTPWGWTVGGRAEWLSCLCPHRPHPASLAPGAKEELGQGRGNAGTRGVCLTAWLLAAGAPGLCPELRAAPRLGPSPCPPPPGFRGAVGHLPQASSRPKGDTCQRRGPAPTPPHPSCTPTRSGPGWR